MLYTEHAHDLRQSRRVKSPDRRKPQNPSCETRRDTRGVGVKAAGERGRLVLGLNPAETTWNLVSECQAEVQHGPEPLAAPGQETSRQ